MKVTFIRPSMGQHRNSDAMEPLAFALLASYSPSFVEHKFYDNRVEEIPYDEETDLVAITVETYTARRAYEIASEFKKRGVKVVMGGYHPTFVPEESLLYADSIVSGDAEELWPKLLNDFKKGKLQKVYRSNNLSSLEGIKPDRSIFKGKRYAPIHLVQYGRGCRFNCDFCSIKAFYGPYLGQRPIKDVVKEIEGLRFKHIFIVDDNIFSYKKQAVEFFKALIPLKVRWSGQVSIDVTQDDELMSLMRKSGCLSVVVGFESLDIKSLIQMKKGWNLRYGTYRDAVKKFRDHGIMVYGTFVHGYDHDTLDSFKYNLEFALESKFYLANFNPLTPTPGAPLYDRLKKEGRLINDPWWLDPDFKYGQAQFIPKNMTPSELTEGCFKARTEFNRFSNIFKRSLDLKANFSSPYHGAMFLASNLISKREIRKKQGRDLADQDKSFFVQKPRTL